MQQMTGTLLLFQFQAQMQIHAQSAVVMIIPQEGHVHHAVSLFGMRKNY